MGIWNEWAHPRDHNGRFISKDQALAGGSGYIRAPRTQHLLHGFAKGALEGAVQGAANQASNRGFEGWKKGMKLGGPNRPRNSMTGMTSGVVTGLAAGSIEGGIKGGIGGAIHGAWRGHNTAAQQRRGRKNMRRQAKANKAVGAAKQGVKKAKRIGRRSRANG